MTAKRKPARSAPSLPVPTANQIEEAMCAFARAKVRYRLLQIGERSFLVEVRPEWMVDATVTGGFPPTFPSEADIAKQGNDAITRRQFHDEASARQWREREIIREAITAGMRAKP